MNRLLHLLTMIFAIVGCSTTTRNPYVTDIDPALQPIVEQWRQDCMLHLERVRCNTYGIESIKISNKIVGSSAVIGQCYMKWDGFELVKTITIRDDVPLDGYYMRALMLHEMIHCRYNYEAHTKTGIMAEYLFFSEHTLENNWPELLEEAYNLVR